MNNLAHVKKEVSMTKKHFIALADLIKSDIHDFTPNAIERLADYCEAENPRFNRERWLDYINGKCGPSGGKRK